MAKLLVIVRFPLATGGHPCDDIFHSIALLQNVRGIKSKTTWICKYNFYVLRIVALF